MIFRMSDLPAAAQERQLARMGRKPDHAARSAGSRRAVRAGDALEVAVWAMALQQSDLVSIEQLPKCGAQFTGKGKAHAQPICCDFAGCVRGGGRAIFFDAKRLDTESALRLGHERLIKAHQRFFLYNQAQAGAIAGLMVAHGGIVRWLDGKHLLSLVRKIRPVRWDDKRWIVLGDRPDFGKLLAAYGEVKS
jgi:hypothetical protein